MANFKIRSIWDYLSISSCTTLILTLCISHIDYTNAILFGSTAKVINRFQSFQNMCTKLILRRPKYSSSMESLYKLHWLAVCQRIDYKILTLTHKCIQGQAPKYLQDLINIKQEQDRNLRSNDVALLLSQPWHQTQNICLKILQIHCTILTESIAKASKRHKGTTTIQKTT